MALASVLKRPLPVNQPGFFGLGGRADLLDLGPGNPSDGLTLAVPGWGVPEEPGIEMLHGTTTLAFKASTTWTVKGTGSQGPPSL
uniref:Proteasome 20S subunit beta 5 n=1 Tax=Cebus imitator TaxID=2715852 RepID=A0A2K5RL60_CEBIM